VSTVDTLVVGAGPQALTVLARWAHDRPSVGDRCLVIDPSGNWLTAWRTQFRQQQIGFLRSPGVHHPAPDEMAFLRRHGDMDASPPATVDPVRADPLERVSGPLRRPAAEVFDEFCRDVVADAGLSTRVVAGRVDELHPERGGWRALLAEGPSVRARQVVWAANPRRRVTPAQVELGSNVVHAADVDLSTVEAGQRIVVLGGGQTAGQLALGASCAGAEVVLVARHSIRTADLDVDAGWLMDDHLVPFRSIVDQSERRQIVERCRRGSMTSDLLDGLLRSGVRWCPDVGQIEAHSTEDGAIVRFAGETSTADTVWVATGSVPDLRVAPALAQVAAAGAEHVDGWPVLSDRLEWTHRLFVVGALAALALGPAAGNLGGARAAADALCSAAP